MLVHDSTGRKMLVKELIKGVVIVKPYMNAIKKKELTIVTNAQNFHVVDLKNSPKPGKNTVRI